jgi:hypothetical protein
MSDQRPVSKTVMALSVSNVVALAGLALSIGFHSTDSSAALEQRVSRNEEAIRDTREQVDQDIRRQEAFENHLDQRLDTQDGKLTDIYHILLEETGRSK